MLFISLNILGLVIGWAILWNIKNNNNEILRWKLIDYLDKQLEEKIKK
ncbi:hypothetical protein [Spiroplasma endosymbiont of Danaus chrysippus]|nr:hypothetical protein [Spiroplasma endosymbiont of Danaus chrysippus]